MRLIDADALWMDVIHTMDYCDDILEIIEKSPTIEPETEEEAYERGYTAGQMAQRKPGKWIVGANHGLMVHTLTCDRCNHSEVSSSVPNFCPNCGADMRGEQDGINNVSTC